MKDERWTTLALIANACTIRLKYRPKTEGFITCTLVCWQFSRQKFKQKQLIRKKFKTLEGPRTQRSGALLACRLVISRFRAERHERLPGDWIKKRPQVGSSQRGLPVLPSHCAVLTPLKRSTLLRPRHVFISFCSSQINNIHFAHFMPSLSLCTV